MTDRETCPSASQTDKDEETNEKENSAEAEKYHTQNTPLRANRESATPTINSLCHARSLSLLQFYQNRRINR
ncbi:MULTISPECIES: hypothetical protein [Methylomonas]|uniref:Uncharacterized protein n=1 Tax=Methylomonas methanica TaxID=421 RepID=A0ABY2CGW8_METMH|nr:MULTISPECIES: hypothetical protein [Methylomonas]TCV76419.1 hypothetical protein EDE11_13312 [Methylomonas methanica]